MKNKLFIIIPVLVIIAAVSFYFGFYKGKDVSTIYKVNFFQTYENYCNCADCGCPTGPVPISTVEVREGDKVNKPTDPTQGERGFLGWSSTMNSNELFDFDKPVTTNLELYSVWK